MIVQGQARPFFGSRPAKTAEAVIFIKFGEILFSGIGQFLVKGKYDLHNCIFGKKIMNLVGSENVAKNNFCNIEYLIYLKQFHDSKRSCASIFLI